MISLLISILVTALAVVLTAYILPGVSVKSFGQAILVAIVLGFCNAFLKPIMVILTLPITIITLGLFLFVINALIILLVGAILPGFKVKSFGWAMLFSIILSVINYILHWLI